MTISQLLESALSEKFEAGTTSSGWARTSDGQFTIITSAKGYEIYEISNGLEEYYATIPKGKTPKDTKIRTALSVHISKTEGPQREPRYR